MYMKLESKKRKFLSLFIVLFSFSSLQGIVSDKQGNEESVVSDDKVKLEKDKDGFDFILKSDSKIKIKKKGNEEGVDLESVLKKKENTETFKDKKVKIEKYASVFVEFIFERRSENNSNENKPSENKPSELTIECDNEKNVEWIGEEHFEEKTKTPNNLLIIKDANITLKKYAAYLLIVFDYKKDNAPKSLILHCDRVDQIKFRREYAKNPITTILFENWNPKIHNLTSKHEMNFTDAVKKEDFDFKEASKEEKENLEKDHGKEDVDVSTWFSFFLFYFVVFLIISLILGFIGFFFKRGKGKELN